MKHQSKPLYHLRAFVEGEFKNHLGRFTSHEAAVDRMQRAYPKAKPDNVHAYRLTRKGDMPEDTQ